MPPNKQRARPLTKGGPGTAADDQKADGLIVAPVCGGVARLRAAVWSWRLRVPHGAAGHRYLAVLERQLAAHTARNLEAMRRNGWPPDQAEAAAREWLHDLADTAARIALASNGDSR